MTEFQTACANLPPDLRDTLHRVPDRLQACTQEIRLRANAPIILSTPDGEKLVRRNGEPSEYERVDLLICTQRLLDDCFQSLCDYSVHTHQQEIREGYISTKNGCRVGVAGSIVTQNREILSMRSITSLCIRVARRHEGCSSALLRRLLVDGVPHSTLICGEPSSGKSSLLRDLASQLSLGRTGRRYRVAVVDERGELSANGVLANCDVLLHCPKGQGVQLAVRSLAPEFVVFDELGSREETEAVRAGLNSGVTAIASAHCRDFTTLLHRPAVRTALEDGLFEQVVVLAGRDKPGSIENVYETGDLFAEDSRIAFGGGGRRVPRSVRLGWSQQTCVRS